MRGRWKETDCQRAQVKYLEARRATVRDLMFCAIPNDAAMFATNGKVNFAKMNGLKAMGLVPGAPDLIVWQRGKTLHIENKVKGKRPTAAQEAFGAALMALGHSYHVLTAETPSEAMDKLIALLEAP